MKSDLSPLVTSRVRDSSGGLILTPFLPLTIDYAAETCTDLFGNTWEFEIGGAKEFEYGRTRGKPGF
jgi:hypothetical protein